ncbi:MAG TPA: hypothetical protein VH459_02240 [Gaiellales bacterium]|jgi:hypothetical protein
MPALTIVWMWTPVLVGLCVLFGVLFGWRWGAGCAVMMLMQLVLDQFVDRDSGWGSDIVLVASVMAATLVWSPSTKGRLRQIGLLIPAGAVFVVVMHVL